MKSDLYNHGLTEEQFYAPYLDTDFWERPASWISVPEVNQGDNIVYILCRIKNDDQNWVHFVFGSTTGNYSVNWGDGSAPQSFASGNIASRNISFADVDPLSVQPDGTRQCVITVTVDNTLSRFQFSLPDGSIPSGQRFQGLNFLEIKMASTAMVGNGSSTFFSNPNKPNYLEQVQVKSPVGSTFLRSNIGDNAFNACRSLRRVVFEGEFVGGSFVNMFISCSNLRRSPVLPLAPAATVSSTAAMFSGCSSLLDITALPVAFFEKTQTCVSMFQNCSTLISVPSVLNLLTTTSTVNMFNGCRSLKFAPRINAPAATSTANLFQNCQSIESVPGVVAPLSTSASNMFATCQALRSVGEISLHPTSPVDCATMFSGTLSLRNLPNLSFSISNPSGMFNGSGIVDCPPLTLNLAAGTRALTSMFNACVNLRESPVLTFVGLLPNNTSTMFSSCNSLKKVNLFDTSQVTNISSMFNTCESLQGNITMNLTACVTMTSAFSSCFSLTSVNLVGMTSAPNNISGMFNGCASLVEVDGLNLAGISSAAGVGTLFSGCNSLKRAPLTGLRYGVNTMLSNTGSLSRDGIVEMFTSLGTAVGAQTITFPGTTYWGPAQVTAADKLIATSKGWTVAGTA